MAQAPQATQSERVTAVAPPPFTLEAVSESRVYLKTLFYGPPGAGKTTLCASAADVPGMRDVVFMNAESGLLSLKANDRVQNAGAIDEVKIKNFASADKVSKWLEAHCKFRDEGNDEKLAQLESKLRGVEVTSPKKYYTVLVDSVSEIDSMCMYGVLGMNEGNVDISEEVPIANWDAYRQNNIKMQVFGRRLRDLPMNVLMACGRRWTQDEMKRYHYTPALTGQLATQVQGFVDLVGFLDVGTATEGKEQPRRLTVQPVNKIEAKCRFASFKGTHFEDPTIGSILKAVNLDGNFNLTK